MAFRVGDGLNIWLPLEDNSQAIAFALAKSGWLVREGEVFGVNTPAHGLRITLSTLSTATLISWRLISIRR
jgi:DNA-binding transcriptional MocR family regulator